MILIVIILVVIFLMILLSRASIWDIAYYVVRSNLSPSSSLCILILLSRIKKIFKKGLTKKTYNSITDWNLVYEIGNRYVLSFSIMSHEMICYVVADSSGGISIHGLNMNELSGFDSI